MKDYILQELQENKRDHEFIAHKIDKLSDQINDNNLKLIESINQNKVDISGLKIKVGLIGIIAGSSPSIVAKIIEHFK